MDCCLTVLEHSLPAAHFIAGVAAKACAVNVVASALRTLKRKDVEIGKVASQTPERPLEALVRGDAVKVEFRDAELDVAEAVASSTCNAKDFVKTCPLFFFGRARQGKSTLVNDLLDVLGDGSRPAAESFLEPCTRGVHVYRQPCTSWTTPGVEEEVLLLDTEGWEFGKSAVDVFKECMNVARKAKIQEEVLKNRLVLLCVLNAEDRSDMGDAKFMRLVQQVCGNASKAARGGKPVLLPIVSKGDLFRRETERDLASQAFRRALHKEVGHIIEVREALTVSHEETDAEGRRPSIEQLNVTLKQICTQQLKSEHILAAVTDIIETDLRSHLMEWEKKGLDAGPSLVRRFLWVAARHRGLRIRGLYKGSPMMSWHNTSRVCKDLKRFPSPVQGGAANDDWHDDPLRERRRQSCNVPRCTSTCSTSSGPPPSLLGASAGEQSP
mmetsp:Transcript_100629/g.285124  ORF Transcript_100629/g.285124 Transcript_100629/m.285124 type:complete len:440 (-) Transcript_100629:343-1662(-)